MAEQERYFAFEEVEIMDFDLSLVRDVVLLLLCGCTRARGISSPRDRDPGPGTRDPGGVGISTVGARTENPA